MNSSSDRIALVLAAYLATSVLFVLFSFFPEGRVWGFNLLAYFSPPVTYSLAAALLIGPIIILIIMRKVNATNSDGAGRSSAFLWFVMISTAIAVCCFYFFRTTTHFDGDGYLSLSNLYGGADIVKLRNFGATGLQVTLYSILGKGGESAALTAYQIVSWGSGIFFLVIAAVISRSLFQLSVDRMLFFAGTAVGGYSLQFFGYVENYSLFIVVVAFYLLVGVLIIQGQAPRWTAVPMNFLALFFHIFGLLFVPATIYLLVRKTKVAARLSVLSFPVKAMLLFVALLPIFGVFLYFYLTNYFFRFAFLPVLADRFTASGYTVFSPKHLIDILNLLFLLCPGLLVLVVAALTARRSISWRSDQVIFLTLAAACALTGVLVFDPKLGMARDWDVFAFAGVPLSMLLLFVVLNGAAKHRGLYVALFATAWLGFIVTSVSVAIRVNDKIAVDRFKSFVRLDPVRNRNNGYFISLYYRQHGEPEKAEEEARLWKASIVDDSMSMEGYRLFQAGRVNEGMVLYRKLLKINPFFSGGYYTIGRYFVETNQLDSAREYFRIGLGMQPDYPILWKNLGWVEARMGDLKSAEKSWLRAAAGDSAYAEPRVLLLGLYQQENRPKEYLNCLLSLAKCPDAPADKLAELTVHYCQTGQMNEARTVLDRAVKNGLDSLQYENITRQYPGLRR